MQTIAIVNQKGGVGKSTTAVNLGAGLVRQGKKVFLVDADSQANLTEMLGWQQPDELSPTLSSMMEQVIADKPVSPQEGILHHKEGMELIPANIELNPMYGYGNSNEEKYLPADEYLSGNVRRKLDWATRSQGLTPRILLLMWMHSHRYSQLT